MKIIKIYFIVIFTIVTLIAGQNTNSGLDKIVKKKGILKGTVINSATKEPLSGVNVTVIGTKLGAETDDHGKYVIRNIPVGTHRINYQFMGFKPVIKDNVVIKSSKSISKDVSLEETDLELEGLDVTLGYFEDTYLSTVSARKLDYEEISLLAGGFGDVQRAIQTLPSVVSQSDHSNEVIVRGGNPGENLFIFDGIEVDNINHFGNQTTGGGPVSMFHNNLLADINFSAGGFSAKYGEKCSSVMDLTLKNGADEFEGKVSMGMSGLQADIEGPISNGSNYILSFNKSYLDLIIGAIDKNGIPAYWSTQGKINYKINEKNTLLFNLLYGSESIEEIEEDENTGVEEVFYNEGYKIISGFNLQTLFKNGFMNNIIYGTNIYSYTDETEDESEIFYQDDTENSIAFKNETFFKLTDDLDLDIGLQSKYYDLEYNTTVFSDTSYYWIKATGIDSLLAENDIMTTIREIDDEWSNINIENVSKVGGYSELTYNLSQYSIKFGVRADYLDLNKETTYSPRLSLSYDYNLFKFNIAGGRYFQVPPLKNFFYGNELNDLSSYYNDQIIFGVDYLPLSDTKITTEIFYKGYKKAPQLIDNYIIQDGNTVKQVNYENIGEGFAYGIEMFIQKNLQIYTITL